MSGFFLPTSEREVLDLLQGHPEARLIAGGTDLLVRLRQSLPADWPPLIGLDHVAAWQGVREEESLLAIGACTSFSRLIADPLLTAAAPILHQAARTIGAPAIRNMATLGGNLCTASPAGDSLPPLNALNAQVELMSREGCRRLPLDQFITGSGTTRLAVGEVITRVLLPKGHAFSHQRFEKVGRRQSLAIAVASFAGVLRLDGKGRVAEARFAWGSVGPTVLRLPAVEALLAGRKVDRVMAREAVEQVRAAVAPIGDIRASARYRRALAGNLLLRFLQPLYA